MNPGESWENQLRNKAPGATSSRSIHKVLKKTYLGNICIEVGDKAKTLQEVPSEPPYLKTLGQSSERLYICVILQ